MQEKESWNTELEIYKLPRMRHPNILEFLGHEKHTEKIQQEFWLISAYQHNGSLCDYLKSHTITYQELCKIAESMACGLAHLHEEIFSTKSEGLKPSIAHRDFKSKNVLLKNDLTACIADFGLAMVFQPGKFDFFVYLFICFIWNRFFMHIIVIIIYMSVYKNIFYSLDLFCFILLINKVCDENR